MATFFALDELDVAVLVVENFHEGSLVEVKAEGLGGKMEESRKAGPTRCQKGGAARAFRP